MIEESFDVKSFDNSDFNEDMSCLRTKVEISAKKFIRRFEFDGRDGKRRFER